MGVLETILEHKRRQLAAWPRRTVSVETLRAALAARGDQRDFIAALQQPRLGQVALIAELKQASPSAGVIRPDFDPVLIAKEYEAAGASCLSVLTEEEFFQGAPAHLRQVRQAVALPLLQKDFIIDERQILPAIESGADAILLIVAALADAQLERLHRLAVKAGLAVLVEAHDEAELDRALAIEAQLIGVNNRDLKTFRVDLSTTERLAGRLRASPEGRGKLLVAESGIRNRADVRRLARCGVQAILVGEALLRENRIADKARELLGADEEGSA
jgi:indole-3-glycerol phosphate synthase